MLYTILKVFKKRTKRFDHTMVFYFSGNNNISTDTYGTNTTTAYQQYRYIDEKPELCLHFGRGAPWREFHSLNREEARHPTSCI